MINVTEKYGVNITATNREFLNMYQVFQETRDVKNVKYATILVINCRVIKQHLDELEALAMPTPEFIELAKEAQKFIQAEDEASLKKLEEEHAELVEARKNQMADVNRRLDEEATLELKMLNEKILPSELSADQLEAIAKLIN
jgi:hypothetical protein